MTSPITPSTQLDLMGYADGQLDAARRREIEQLLAHDPDLLAAAQAIAMQNEAIGEAYGDVLDERLPARLMAVVERAHPARRATRLRQAVAIMALALATGVAGWWGGDLVDTTRSEDIEDFVDAAAIAHLAWADPSSRPISSASLTPSAPPLEWLSERVTLELGAPSLAANGYQSIDKTLADVDGRPTVRLTFERQDGKTVSLFLSTRWRESPPTFNLNTEGEAPSVYWLDGPLMWVLTGSLEAGELAALAEMIHDTARLRPRQAGRRPIQNNVVDLDAPPAAEGVPTR